jgi:hypothetical protein
VHDVQGAEEKKGNSSYYNVSENKRIKIQKKTLYLVGAGNYSRICAFHRNLET